MMGLLLCKYHSCPHHYSTTDKANRIQSLPRPRAVRDRQTHWDQRAPGRRRALCHDFHRGGCDVAASHEADPREVNTRHEPTRSGADTRREAPWPPLGGVSLGKERDSSEPERPPLQSDRCTSQVYRGAWQRRRVNQAAHGDIPEGRNPEPAGGRRAGGLTSGSLFHCTTYSQQQCACSTSGSRLQGNCRRAARRPARQETASGQPRGGAAPGPGSASGAAEPPPWRPPPASSAVSASPSALASVSTSGLRSCLNIHLATLSAMPPVVWRQEAE